MPTAYGDGVGDDPVAGHDLAIGPRAAYPTTHRRANAEFARFGLTADRFVLLTAPAEAGGATREEPVRRAASDANTMSEMLGHLERIARGKAARGPGPRVAFRQHFGPIGVG